MVLYFLNKSVCFIKYLIYKICVFSWIYTQGDISNDLGECLISKPQIRTEKEFEVLTRSWNKLLVLEVQSEFWDSKHDILQWKGFTKHYRAA